MPSNVQRAIVNFIVNWTPTVEVKTLGTSRSTIDFIQNPEGGKSIGEVYGHTDQVRYKAVADQRSKTYTLSARMLISCRF